MGGFVKTMEEKREIVLRQKPSVMTKCLKRIKYESWPHLFPCLRSSRWIPHSTSRWVLTSVLIITFILRIIIKQGWYIVTYAWSIFLLNHLTAFLTSKIDPANANLETEKDNGLKLPIKQNDEFRPFIRHLPEFKFWYSVTTATLIAFGCTFFEILDIPVFWQILVIYFIVLFCITIRRLKKVLRVVQDQRRCLQLETPDVTRTRLIEKIEII